MLDITKLQTAQASNEQIAAAKRLYGDLEELYDLELFVKSDHIRIYVRDRGWLRIARNGQTRSFLKKSQERQIVDKLTPETTTM